MQAMRIITISIVLIFGFAQVFGQANSATSLKDGKTQTSTYRIMPIGDSKTEGGGGGNHQSWRGYLRAKLIENGFSIDYVGDRSNYADGDIVPNDKEHSGHGGYTIGPDTQRFGQGSETTGIAEHVKAWLKIAKPDIVVLSVGINDFFNGDKHPTNYAATAPTRYQSLVDSILSFNPLLQIIICTVEPVKWDKKWGTNPNDKNLGALNAKIRQIAKASETDNIFLADLQTDFLATWAQTDFWDDIHLAKPGATKVANTIYNTFSKVITTTSIQLNEVKTKKIFPNPVNSNQPFTIQLAGSYPDSAVSIFNLAGQNVFSASISQSSSQIQTEGLKNGIYFVRIANGNDVSVEKLIIR